MDNNLKSRLRKSLRLKNYDYSQTGMYFITICTFNRQYLFGEVKNEEMILNENGKIIEKWWLSLPNKFNGIELDEFIIMPNHLHGIIFIVNENKVGVIYELPLQNNSAIEHRRMILPKIVGYFKMNSAKYINECRGIQGTSVWQRNYFEHIIRPGKSLDKIRNYIFNNAAKWENDLENLEFIKNLSEEEINKKIAAEYKDILI